jgi:type 1 glutamine amidotransferase
MSKIVNYLLVFFSLITLCNCTSKKTVEDTPTPPIVQEEIKKPLHLVFVTGDEEYRSEESMPMLADILQRELNCKISICYSLDEEGFVDPNNTKHISGLEALDSADLMIMFTRFRELPDNELRYIAAYADSGKPIVGFRTATHAFLYKTNKEREFYNEEWPIKVFGQKWITHHGHFNDGENPLTRVEIIDAKKTSPILNGVKGFDAYSWLYHVEGGNDKLAGDSDPLLLGTSLQSTHQEKGNLDKYPLTNPVAWTKSYTGSSEKSCRVFFTTLGHPYDFKETSIRKLALNGIYWALGLEEQIPPDGVNAALASEYEPNPSGMGDHYKKQLKPRTF